MNDNKTPWPRIVQSRPDGEWKLDPAYRPEKPREFVTREQVADFKRVLDAAKRRINDPQKTR